MGSHNEITQAVLEQYDSAQGHSFYRQVMGDQGFNIHYGIYSSENETMRQASENTIAHLVEQAQQQGLTIEGAKVLDLGSGTGGAAHYLAQHHGCCVYCINISPEQNRVNEVTAASLGIEHLIHTVTCSFDDLPKEFANQFDLVWSEEALCHAPNKAAVIKEAQRVLKPGGTFVFTDIMKGELAEDTSTFSDRNAVTTLASPSEYLKLCLGEGFQNLVFSDISHHLPLNFEKMIAQIDQNYDALISNDVSEAYLKSFRQSLSDRISAAFSGNFSWFSFAMNKPPVLENAELKSVLLGRHVHQLPPLTLTPENLGELGTLYPYETQHADTPEVPVNAWPCKGKRALTGRRGIPQLAEDDMTMHWQGPRLNATNTVLEETYTALAYRDEQSGYYIEWFNQHVDSGQKFHCPNQKLLYILAPPVENPCAQDFKAFLADGTHGLVINPGVWHTNPIPLTDEAVSLQTTQSTLNATRDVSLSAELNQLINITEIDEATDA